MCDLPFIVWNRLRPKHLSDPHYDNTVEHLRDILAKSDNELDCMDYCCLLGPWVPAGTYDEVIYFLPHAFRYFHNDEEGAFEMMTALIGFVSIQAEALEADEILEPSRQELRYRIQRWTQEFNIQHHNHSECRSEGSGQEYSDTVLYSCSVCSMLEEIDRFCVHVDLAINFVATLVDDTGDQIKAAWHLELARAHVEGLLAAKDAELRRLLTEHNLLRASADMLLPDILKADNVSTYWSDTFSLLGL